MTFVMLNQKTYNLKRLSNLAAPHEDTKMDTGEDEFFDAYEPLNDTMDKLTEQMAKKWNF